ncbi:hypothetical protein [Dactylosporangium sp. CS-033363]|uniref:hypothetical protein n=1 Tax=Dactylosporangium sp. CS-033363 TaxID=3239935 RepID=UPI003D8CDA94
MRLIVTGLAATHVAGILAGHVLPWTGTTTMTALLLYALSVPGPRPRVAGFACLAVLAASIDARTGGHGFPNCLIYPADPARHAVEGTLLVLGVGLLLVAALGRGFAVVALLAVLTAPALYAWTQPPDPSSLQPVISAQERLALIARARAQAGVQDGAIVAIAVSTEPPRLLPPVVAPPDWSRGLLPAVPAAVVFAALAAIATGRGTEDPA